MLGKLGGEEVYCRALYFTPLHHRVRGWKGNREKGAGGRGGGGWGVGQKRIGWVNSCLRFAVKKRFQDCTCLREQRRPAPARSWKKSKEVNTDRELHHLHHTTSPPLLLLLHLFLLLLHYSSIIISMSILLLIIIIIVSTAAAQQHSSAHHTPRQNHKNVTVE